MDFKKLYEAYMAEHRDIVAEPPAYLFDKDTYTVDDLERFPAGIKAELSDGELIYMELPTVEHQDMILEVCMQLQSFIMEKGGSCRVHLELGIQLDESGRDYFIPDAVVLCDRDKLIERRRIVGGADLVIEVLSPSTRKKDMNEKRRKYKRAGVREYWMIDLEAKKVIVCEFEKEDSITMYNLTDKVPVGIWDKKCEIDFEKITTYIL